MTTHSKHVSRATVVLAVATFATLAYAASDKDAIELSTNPFSLPEGNHLAVSGQTVSVSGNKAAFQARSGYSADGNGGVQSFVMKEQLTKDIDYKVDGHALFGSDDYLLKLRLTKADFGYVDAGYQSYRTYYDGIGGFFPNNAAWFPMPNQELHLDRTKAWVEAVIKLPDKPEIRVRFCEETRDGKKDTTAWGDSNLTGLPTTPTNNANRKIVAGYLDLDEKHQTLEASVKHTIGKTLAELKVGAEWIDNYDTRYMTQYRGESTLNKNPNNETQLRHGEGVDSTVFYVHATTRTELSEQLSLLAGFGYEHIDANISGVRSSYVPATNLLTYPFRDLKGNSKTSAHTGNVGVEYKPVSDLFIQASLKAEKEYNRNVGSYTRVTGSTPTALTSSLYNENSRNKDRAFTPELSARYNGIRRVVVYGSASYRRTNGDERSVTPFNTLVPANSAYHYTDSGEGHTNAKFGANWNVNPLLSLKGEVFLKNHTNRFVGYSNSLGSYYVLGYKYTGLKLSATVKPSPILSLTTRYQPQMGTMELTRGTLVENESMDAKIHMVSQSVDITPTPELYIQGSVSLVYDTASTAYPKVGGTANYRIRNSDNNYWTGSATTGYKFSKATAVEAQASYYKSNNWEPGPQSTQTIYGASEKEASVTLELKHSFTKQIQAGAKVGYIKFESEMTGGRADFEAKVAYATVTYVF